MGCRTVHMVAWALLLLTGVNGASEQTKVTPIQKVLTLMEDMKAKGIAEKNDEETKFSAFSQWCQNTKKAQLFTYLGGFRMIVLVTNFTSKYWDGT